MAKGSKRKATNELEFQGEALRWLNTEIHNRKLGLDRATQEKPRSTSGKRNDLVIWQDRAAETPFLTIELKTPATPINDLELLGDAIEKAHAWQSPYFAIWNMSQFEVYQTPPAGGGVLPTDAIARSGLSSPLRSVEEWLVPEVGKALREQACALLDAAIEHSVRGSQHAVAIDAEIFVTRITHAITALRQQIYFDLSREAKTHRRVRRALNAIATEQGFIDFVDDIDDAIAGQISYRYIGQILFYHALRRKLSTLPEIVISSTDSIPSALTPYWNEVRRYDYEALFGPHPLDELVPLGRRGQFIVRQLIAQFSEYDWASLKDDVLGSIFERLIPQTEQTLLGQFYTPQHVADLLIAFTVDGEAPSILDPGCGSGTFLMRAYSYLSDTRGLSHSDLLSHLWGFDVSAFAAELAVINLYRQDMAAFDNFPRVVVGSFIDREPGQTVLLPPSRRNAGAEKVAVPIPTFDAVLANPPYVRSQHQDDLDPHYRSKLFLSARKAGFSANAKTDLFAFFIYHSLQFLSPGGRMGFVTSSSWLTADFAAELQRALLTKVRIVAIITSEAESFFTQVEINTVLIIAELPTASVDLTQAIVPFIALRKTLTDLTSGPGNYWDRLHALVDELESITSTTENDRYRARVVLASSEAKALADQAKPRNWSRYLRAPLSYYQIFGDE